MSDQAEFQVFETWVIGPKLDPQSCGSPGTIITDREGDTVAHVIHGPRVDAYINSRLVAVAPAAIGFIRDMCKAMESGLAVVERDTCWHGTMKQMLAWVDG